MPKPQYDKLHSNSICKQTQAVKNKYESLEEVIDSKQNTFRESHMTITKEISFRKERQEQKNKWMTDEILNLMEM